MSVTNYEEGFERAARLRDNGKVAEAILMYQDLATLAQEEHNTTLAAEAHHMAGNAVKMTIAHGEESRFRAASEFFSKAYALYRSIGDVTQQGAVLRDIAIAADKAGRFSIATESFQRSIEILSQSDDTAQLAITYDKLGRHFLRTGQPQQALPYMDKALDMLRQTPASGFFWATTLFDRALVKCALRDFAGAREDAEDALSWFAADHDGATYDVRRAESMRLLSFILERQGDKKQAERYLAAANKLLRTFDTEVAARFQSEVQAWTSGL